MERNFTYTYHELFTKVFEFELQQAKEAGDKAKSDKYRSLPYEQGKRVTNEIIKEFVRKAPFRFEKDCEHIFTSSTNTFIAPRNVKSVLSLNIDGVDYTIDSMTNRRNDIPYARSSRELYYYLGWEKGDTLYYRAVVFPDDISYALDEEIADTVNFPEGTRTGDQDPIVWPIDYERLLYLEAKRRMRLRKDGNLSQYEFAEYMQLKSEWEKDQTDIVQVMTTHFGKSNLGKR